MTFNQLGIAGIVGKEPKFDTTTTGIQYCSFTLVVDASFMGKSGQNISKTMHVQVKAWGKVCEEARNRLTMGSSLLIGGTLKQDSWKDESGNMQSMVSINASNITYLEDLAPVSNKSNTDMVKETFPGKVKDGIDLPDDLPF